MKLKAYAKINLYLKVLGKKNNYHLLKMINAKINLFDEIDISEGKTNELIFKNCLLDPVKDNLIIKIIEYFQNTYKIEKKYKVEITKHIPIMAGLGGGSSDAAEIIKFLNVDNNLNLDLKELEKIGILFGADIPYCLYNIPCLVEGIGEKITPFSLPDELKTKDILVVNPNINLATKDVFCCFDKLSLEPKNQSLAFFEENDLELAAFSLNKELSKIKNDLKKYPIEKIVMSGSGSTFIAIVDKNKSEYMYNEIKKQHDWFVSINQLLEV